MDYPEYQMTLEAIKRDFELCGMLLIGDNRVKWLIEKIERQHATIKELQKKNANLARKLNGVNSQTQND